MVDDTPHNPRRSPNTSPACEPLVRGPRPPDLLTGRHPRACPASPTAPLRPAERSMWLAGEGRMASLDALGQKVQFRLPAFWSSSTRVWTSVSRARISGRVDR
jgi:hypothetical protein